MAGDPRGDIVIEVGDNRINFLIRSRSKFTYRRILYIFAVWFSILIVLYGLQLVRYAYLERSVAAARESFERLNAQKEKHIELIEALSRRNVGLSARKDLSGILEVRPRWSLVLRALTRRLPPQVWLGEMRVYQDEKEVDVMEIKGRAKSQRALTTFVMQIESEGKFDRTELVGTRRIADTKGVLEYDLRTYPIMAAFLRR